MTVRYGCAGADDDDPALGIAQLMEIRIRDVWRSTTSLYRLTPTLLGTDNTLHEFGAAMDNRRGVVDVYAADCCGNIHRHANGDAVVLISSEDDSRATVESEFARIGYVIVK